MIGTTEKEIKILDLTNEDIARIDKVLLGIGAKKVADYKRRIMTLDNGTSNQLNQLLRITEEDGYTKVTLHINQSDEENKRHIKFHLPKSDKLLELLECRYNENIITDTTARRISYELGDEETAIDFDIDCFDKIPPFMEIDLENLSKYNLTLETLLQKLKLNDKKCVVLGTESIHSLYGIDYFEAYSKDSF